MDEQSAAELRLEPGGLRRHDRPRVRDRHHLADRHGLHRERHGVLAGVDLRRERRVAADAAHERDALIRARIADPENRREKLVLKIGNVERADHIRPCGNVPRKVRPLPLEIHAAQEGAV